jgi:hypothetical protein
MSFAFGVDHAVLSMSDCVQVAFLSNLVIDYFIRKMATVHGAVPVDQITVFNKKYMQNQNAASSPMII